MKTPRYRGVYMLLMALSLSFLACEQSDPANTQGNGDPNYFIPAKALDQPFRVAVVQSGDYLYYRPVMVSIYQGLAHLGWVQSISFDYSSNQALGALPSVAEISSQFQQQYTPILFPPELFFDLQWQKNEDDTPGLSALLEGQTKADAVIIIGTLAAEIALNYARSGRLKVPVLLESVSDPIGIGIASVGDSGFDLVTANCDPLIVQRQIRMFHKLSGFKRLGLVHSTSLEGQLYAGINHIRGISRELGFETISYTRVSDDPKDVKDLAVVEEEYIKGIEYLSTRVDALYLAIQAGLTERSLPRVLRIAQEHRIPTFAAEGSIAVELGALMGESAMSLDDEGLHSARKLVRILRGELPRSQAQEPPHNTHISLNIGTARLIGFKFTMETLLQADSIYTSTDTPSDGQK